LALIIWEIRTGIRQQGQNKLAVLTIYKREELASRGSNDTTNLINEHRHPNSSDTTQSENNAGSQQNKRYNELDKKDRVVKSSAKPDLKSTSRGGLKQLYAEKLSKYAERSQGKFSEKVEKAIFDAEKASKRLKNIDEV
jgi:hypothetical protein